MSLSSFSILIFPCSILDTSSTSLIIPIRWFPASLIFSRQSLTLSWSRLSILFCAIEAYPRITFIGVLISCDISERNFPFALLALSACASASSIRSCCSISFFITSSMSLIIRITLTGSPFFRFSTTTLTRHHLNTPLVTCLLYLYSILSLCFNSHLRLSTARSVDTSSSELLHMILPDILRLTSLV